MQNIDLNDSVVMNDDRKQEDYHNNDDEEEVSKEAERKYIGDRRKILTHPDRSRK